MDNSDSLLSGTDFRGLHPFGVMAERQLEQYGTAAEEGLPLVDQEEPLITGLLLVALARDVRKGLRRRLPALAALRRSLSHMVGGT